LELDQAAEHLPRRQAIVGMAGNLAQCATPQGGVEQFHVPAGGESRGIGFAETATAVRSVSGPMIRFSVSKSRSARLPGNRSTGGFAYSLIETTRDDDEEPAPVCEPHAAHELNADEAVLAAIVLTRRRRSMNLA
jgi:hypothetical protein